MPHYLIYPGAVPEPLAKQIAAAKIPFLAAESTYDWLRFLGDNEHGVSQVAAADLIPVEQYRKLLPKIPTLVTNVPDMGADMAFLSRAAIFPAVTFTQLADHISKSGRTTFETEGPRVGARPSRVLTDLAEDMEPLALDEPDSAEYRDSGSAA